MSDPGPVHRFRFSDSAAGDFELPDVEAVLDALEAALVTPETPMLDLARQSWQPVAAHPEVRSAWDQRSRFRPPGTGLDLPPLPEPETPLEADDLAKRRAAYALVVRGNRMPVDDPVPEEPPPRRSIAVAVALVIALLLLVGFSVIELAGSLLRVAARAVRISP